MRAGCRVGTRECLDLSRDLGRPSDRQQRPRLREIRGGNSSRYPAGNRFEEPFEVKIPAGTAFVGGPGANIRMLLAMAENVRKGLLVEFPAPPSSVRVIL